MMVAHVGLQILRNQGHFLQEGCWSFLLALKVLGYIELPCWPFPQLGGDRLLADDFGLETA